MSESDDVRLPRIFRAVLERSDEDRTAVLDELCGADNALKDRLRQMLESHQPTGDLAAAWPTAGDADPEFDSSAVLGRRIAHYHLRRVIATGGMGVVYEAVQEHPHRIVALKLLKPDVASPSVVRRFESESQILARLRHPNIAQVYEAGMHVDPSIPGGDPMPFFAMEYIPNARTLLEYANERKMSARERLTLFVKVCDAVHHGHQRGIIHRDLKPGNILVDSGGEPKIIDFGVARATDSDLAVTTLLTDVGQLLGTLQYMSPEQCDADPHDLDSRSDIYTLGVVLYELLCDRLPYDVAGSGVQNAIRMICTRAPERPSSFDRRLRGDVETITLMALAKERSRRYQNASDLAGDIRRYLRDEPILARPPSVLYQLRKLARRRTGLVCVVGSLLLLLLASGVVAVVYLQWQLSLSRREAALRDRELQKSWAVVEFLQTMLGAASPFEYGSDVTVLEVVRRAASDPGLSSIGDPETEAAIRTAIGAACCVIDELDLAEEHLTRAVDILAEEVGTNDVQYADSRLEQAWLWYEQGGLDEEAEASVEDCLRIYRRNGSDERRIAEALQRLGVIQHQAGRHALAEESLRKARVIIEGFDPPNPAMRLDTQIELASLLAARGNFEEAERLGRDALAGARTLFGEDHAYVALALNGLVQVLRQAGKEDEVEPLVREAVRIGRIEYGSSAALASSLNEFGLMLKSRGAFDEALVVLREAAGIYRERGYLDFEVTIQLSIAIVLDAKGESQKARVEYVEVITRYEEDLEPGHWFVANARSHYGACLTSLGEYERAEEELLSAYEGLAAAGMAERARIAASRLATLYRLLGDDAEAEGWERTAEAPAAVTSP